MLQSVRSHLRAKLFRLSRQRNWPAQKKQVEEHLEVIRPNWRREENPEKLVVVCPVRDGEDHVETFVEHYFRLGAAEIVLLDNGSRDGTVDRAAALERVTVLRCRLPFKTHSYAFRRFLVERFGEGCWCLLTDIDERFDYPASDRLPFRGFLRYLNECGFTAVMTQMLDLFPDGPPAAWPEGGRDLIEASVWYDLSGVKPRPLQQSGRANQFADPEMTFFTGGIRTQAFGANPILTKFSLFHRTAGSGPVLESVHLCRGARVADVSGVLLHYKYDRNFRQRCVTAVKEGNFFGNSAAYKLYLSAVESRPELVLRGPASRRFGSAEELVEQGFLRASHRYREYVRQSERAAALASKPGGDPAG